MLKKPVFLIFLSFCLLLAGCSTFTVHPAGGKPSVHDRSHWALTGRIAVKAGDKGENASLIWQQEAGNYYLKLYGPLGMGAIEIQGTPAEAVLTTSRGKQYRAVSADKLLQEVAGWQLPVGHLKYWIRALPAPHVEAMAQHDAKGRLLMLQQEGWQIDYLAYENLGSAALPRLVALRRVAGDKPLSARIVVDAWQ